MWIRRGTASAVVRGIGMQNRKVVHIVVRPDVGCIALHMSMQAKLPMLSSMSYDCVGRLRLYLGLGT